MTDPAAFGAERKSFLTLIAAVAENRVIGCGGRIPWHLPEDLARFKALTMGHSLIVGRKTFESIGRSLPGRRMIVLTRRASYLAEGCLVARALDEALQLAGSGEIFVGGGAEVYREALSLAHRIHLTVVHRSYEGDVFFPELPAAFVETERLEHGGQLPYTFVTYERRVP